MRAHDGVAGTFGGLIAAQARSRGGDVAVHYEGRAITFAELDEMARRAAGALRAFGVGPGDRVALWLPNSPAYLALWIGCARLGAIAVAINTRFRAVEVADILERSAARILAMWPGFRTIDFLSILGEIDPAALDRLERLIVYDEGEPAAPVVSAIAHLPRHPFAELMENAPLDVDAATPDMGVNSFTTSGTTSKPKFVLHSHAGLTRHAREVAAGFGYAGAEGSMLAVMPLCGVFGFNMATASLAAGMPMVLMNAFDAERAVELMARHDVRHMHGTDDMIAGILRCTRDDGLLEKIGGVGFAIFNAELADIVERSEARGLNLVGLYGMSEVQALFARQALDAPTPERRLGGGYLTSPEGRCRVRDPDSGEILPHGEQGELELAGPSLMAGYYGNAEATAEAITEDGFMRTGDLGYTTADNHFVYVARMGDVLRLGGFLVAPAEIESHLQDHPMVAGAQVVGADTGHGIRPVGFVVAQPGAPFDEAALIDHCRGGLARFKVPMRITAVSAFPTTKSANGFKIQRVRLRDMAEELVGEAAERTASDG